MQSQFHSLEIRASIYELGGKGRQTVMIDWESLCWGENFKDNMSFSLFCEKKAFDIYGGSVTIITFKTDIESMQPVRKGFVSSM